MADLDFGNNAQINYQVVGTSNYIDSRLTSNPDAGTRLKIDGNFVMATIR